MLGVQRRRVIMAIVGCVLVAAVLTMALWPAQRSRSMGKKLSEVAGSRARQRAESRWNPEKGNRP